MRPGVEVDQLMENDKLQAFNRFLCYRLRRRNNHMAIRRLNVQMHVLDILFLHINWITRYDYLINTPPAFR